MKKYKNFMAVMATASALSAGMAFTVFAEETQTGWIEGEEGWHYYDEAGVMASSEWRRNGNNWFWLDENGLMAVDTIVEDEGYYYYVNEEGAMVTNEWVQRANEEPEENEAVENWYYFQNNGRAYVAGDDSTSFKLINGQKYAFDQEGKMLYGWVGANSELLIGDYDWKEAKYYCGPDNSGALQTGWLIVDVEDDRDPDDTGIHTYYFYAASSGKLVKNDQKLINGERYSFDECGVMESEWVKTTDSELDGSTATVSEYKYYNYEDLGNRVSGWFYAVPGEAMDKENHDAEVEKWFYADGSGNVMYSRFKTINGKKYAFGESGEMLTGLQAIQIDRDNPSVILKHHELDGDSDLAAYARTDNNYENFDFADTHLYYFGDSEEEDGAMRLGKQKVHIDGVDHEYFFAKSGTYTGMGYGNEFLNSDYAGMTDIFVYGSSELFRDGKKIKADEGEKYQAFTVYGELVGTGEGKEGNLLLNESGSIMKNRKNLKDANEYYYCTDKYGFITRYSADKCVDHDNH